MDVLTINQTIRSLVSDPNADYADDPYLQPKLNLRYTDMQNELRLYGPDVDEYVVELMGVPAGTPDLSGYSGQNQPLYWLIQPREIEWKLAGQPAINYVDADGPIDKIREIPVPGIQALDCWSYTHYNIGLSMFSTALDLRIRGEFLYAPLTAGGDYTLLGNNILAALSFRVASLIAIERGNPNWAKDYTLEGDKSFDHIKQAVTHLRQGKGDTRVGRVNGDVRFPRYNISS